MKRRSHEEYARMLAKELSERRLAEYENLDLQNPYALAGYSEEELYEEFLGTPWSDLVLIEVKLRRQTIRELNAYVKSLERGPETKPPKEGKINDKKKDKTYI